MGFFFQGLTLGLAYVAPIGMQNLFVIDSALTKPRRRALLTALIVLFFDVSLSLSCFFGIGKLMQDHAWLKLAILAIGGLVVIRIGAGLLFPGKGGDDGAAQTPQLLHIGGVGMVRRFPRSAHLLSDSGPSCDWLSQTSAFGWLPIVATPIQYDTGYVVFRRIEVFPAITK